MRPGMVTPGFSRDIILDPFNVVKETATDDLSKKPVKAGESIKKWIAKIATNQRQTYRVKRKTSILTNKIIWVEIAIALILAVVWGIRFLTM